MTIFESEAYNQLTISDGKKDKCFAEQDLKNLNKFLKMFTVKINDPISLNILLMDHVSKHINFKRIKALCTHKSRIPNSDFDEEWTEIHSNLLKYYYQYNLKKAFYFLNRLHVHDLKVTHPLFRHEISIINKKLIKDVFSCSEEKKEDAEENEKKLLIFEKQKNVNALKNEEKKRKFRQYGYNSGFSERVY